MLSILLWSSSNYPMHHLSVQPVQLLETPSTEPRFVAYQARGCLSRLIIHLCKLALTRDCRRRRLPTPNLTLRELWPSPESNIPFHNGQKLQSFHRRCARHVTGQHIRENSDGLVHFPLLLSNQRDYGQFNNNSACGVFQPSPPKCYSRQD
jgi:hypothetical protein